MIVNLIVVARDEAKNAVSFLTTNQKRYVSYLKSHISNLNPIFAL